MSTFLNTIGSIVTAAATWVASAAQVAVGYVPATESTAASWNPNIITFMILFGFVGTGIGLLRRLMNVD